MINETDLVAILINLPKANLIRGDVGIVVIVHGDQLGFEVEFVNASGRTIAVEALYPDQIKKIDQAMAILHDTELQLTTAK